MKLRAPDEGSVADAVDEYDVPTLLVPREDTVLSDEQSSIMRKRIHRIKDTRTERGERGRVFEIRSRVPDDSELVGYGVVDIGLLAKVLYEHRRYSVARGFSDTEMDVLRAIEFHESERVTIDEIMNSEHAADIGESTVYKSLRTLQEKELIDKVKPGLYRYVGPD